MATHFIISAPLAPLAPIGQIDCFAGTLWAPEQAERASAAAPIAQGGHEMEKI